MLQGMSLSKGRGSFSASFLARSSDRSKTAPRTAYSQSTTCFGSCCKDIVENCIDLCIISPCESTGLLAAGLNEARITPLSHFDCNDLEAAQAAVEEGLIMPKQVTGSSTATQPRFELAPKKP
mmetsp:Transcript_7129/g.7758  ORF Transcript_7129/g.7758 Transcript_7129/m.7758 type:complete len:123 (+) Transcript_7129:49-417(+)